jgi:hypothetical protein
MFACEGPGEGCAECPMRFEIACKKRSGMILYSAHIHVVEETMCNIGNIVDARGCFPASGFQKFVDNMNKTL